MKHTYIALGSYMEIDESVQALQARMKLAVEDIKEQYPDNATLLLTKPEMEKVFPGLWPGQIAEVLGIPVAERGGLR